MSNDNTNSSGIGFFGFFGLLAIVFITLKLTGHLDRSWWAVTSPLWAPLLIFLFTLSVFVGLAAVLGRK